MGYQDEDELSEEGFLEMMADYDKLDKLQKQYRELPNSPQRVELCREFVALADKLEEPAQQIIGRYDLAWSYAFGDDPAKALPVCAEYIQLQKDNPDATGVPDGVPVVHITMLASSLARRLPQIPLDECERLLMEFRRQVRTYGVGERLWQCHACDFAAMTGDLQGLADHLNRFQAAPRDDTSDCEVCEAGSTGEFMMVLGRLDEAVDIAADLLKEGKYCDEQPWHLLSNLTDDALNRRDLDAAERYATAMLIQPIENPTDLRRAGTLLRMEAAFGAGEDGVKVLEKCLPWTANFWDQELLFYFYLGAADFCQAHSAQHPEIKLPPVPGFADRPATGVYDCAALAQWFWSQAEKIGARFDRRNNCPNYQKKLDAARKR